jgi:hypothetical protein
VVVVGVEDVGPVVVGGDGGGPGGGGAVGGGAGGGSSAGIVPTRRMRGSEMKCVYQVSR